jgi:hypothetical protein
VPRTDTREIYLRDVTHGAAAPGGRGRVAYIPWDIDRTFWEVMCVDHGRLLRNAFAWTANEPAPVEVDGPGVIDVTVWRQRGSMTVHLVNLTNPMMMKGPLRETIPVGPLHARIRLPAGSRPSKVQLLTSGTVPRTSQVNGVLSVTVPSVDVHEVIAIDL